MTRGIEPRSEGRRPTILTIVLRHLMHTIIPSMHFFLKGNTQNRTGVTPSLTAYTTTILYSHMRNRGLEPRSCGCFFIRLEAADDTHTLITLSSDAGNQTPINSWRVNYLESLDDIGLYQYLRPDFITLRHFILTIF